MSQGKISIIELNNTLNDFFSRTDDTQTPGTETTQRPPEDTEPPIVQYKPIELTNYLKEYILGQDEAIDIIATKICTHFNRMAYEKKHSTLDPLLNRIKSNMLLIGPTGVGKTYILKLIAHRLGVPFIKADATKFTETGYVGGDVEDLVRGLVNEANGNIQVAEYGIVYLDEIDKIASTKNSYGPDVSKKGVQHNLLKIMEESEIDLKNPLDISSQMKAVMQAHQTGKSEAKKINTRNILFVMSGAFQDLSDIIKKRLKHNTLGFLHSQDARSTHNEPAEYLKHVQSEDLIEYGFESEFVGRLPVVAVLNPLDQEHLYQILKAPKNTLINSKKRDFKAYDIDIDFDDEALYEVSKYACTEKTGARSLMSILEKRLIYFEKHLPSTRMKHLEVTKELIQQPERYLKYLLTKDAAQQMSEVFAKEHVITLDFSEDAIEYIMHYADTHSVSPYEALTKHLENYGYGLKLVNQSSLTVTQELLQNKEQYLDSLVKSSYKVSQKL